MGRHDKLDATVAELAGRHVLLDSLAHLIRRGHFFSESLYSSILGEFDITSRQMVLLIAIGQNPGASQKTVGELVALDVNTVSDTLRRMERKGLILRETSKSDARTICLRVTELGHSQLQAMEPALRTYHDSLQSRLSDEEAAQLKHLVRKMLQLEETAAALAAQ